MFHFHHRLLHDRDAKDEKRKARPTRTVVVVEELDDEDSDCEKYGL